MFVYIGSSRKISHDLIQYENLYNNFEFPLLLDSLFYWLYLLAINLGFSFRLFLIFYLLLVFELLLMSVKNISKEYFLGKIPTLLIFINCMLFIELFEQSTHFLRQFLACLIILYVSTNKKISQNKSVFYFILAVLIHSVSFIYLPFIIIKIFNLKNFLKFFTLALVVYLFLDLELFYNSKIYRVLVLDYDMADNSDFSSTGLLFVGFGTLLIFVMSVFKKHIIIKYHEIIVILFLILLIQFLPDQFYILKYRFLMFAYIPVTFMILVSLFLLFRRNYFGLFFLGFLITPLNAHRFYQQLGEVFEYNLLFIDVF